MLETFVPLVSNLINRGCVKIQKLYHTVMWSEAKRSRNISHKLAEAPSTTQGDRMIVALHYDTSSTLLF